MWSPKYGTNSGFLWKIRHFNANAVNQLGNEQVGPHLFRQPCAVVQSSPALPRTQFNHRITSRDQTPGLGFWFYCIRNRSCYSLVCNAQNNSMIRSWDWIRPFWDMSRLRVLIYELENRRFREYSMIYASMKIFCEWKCSESLRGCVVNIDYIFVDLSIVSHCQWKTYLLSV